MPTILDYFNLREQPFGVTPDPRFWHASETHREALASILYGLESKRGFVALIAKPGMGKTTVLFNGLHRMNNTMRTVFLFQQITTPESLVRAALADLGIDETQGDLVQLQRRLNEVCAEQARQGKRIVLVIDEAQSLEQPVLEFVRMLSNFETTREKLLQIVLSGQPQLAENLAAEAMVQLRQRISILAHLKPLSESETMAYINHRLRIAGYCAPSALFTSAAMAMISRESQGIPRNINNLCFNAMSVGFALRRRVIDRDILHEVIADLSLNPLIAKDHKISQLQACEAIHDIEQLSCRQLSPVRPFVQRVLDFLNQRELGETTIIAPKRTKREVKARRRSQLSGEARVEPVQAAPKHYSGFLLSTLVSAKDLFSRRHFGLISNRRAAGAGLLVAMAVPLLVISLWKRASVEAVRAADRRVTVVSQTADAPALSASALTRSSLPSTLTIVVKPGEFLDNICTENFGSCSPELVQKILDLNPQIEEPDYIEAGQLIRIPATGTNPAPSTRSNHTARAQRNTP